MRRHNIDVLFVVKVVDQFSDTLGLGLLQALTQHDFVLILQLATRVNHLAEYFDCYCALSQQMCGANH